MTRNLIISRLKAHILWNPTEFDVNMITIEVGKYGLM